MSNTTKILFHDRALSDVKQAVHGAGLIILKDKKPVENSKNLVEMTVKYPQDFNLQGFYDKLRRENTDVR